jgi:hypothetical protein
MRRRLQRRPHCFSGAFNVRDRAGGRERMQQSPRRQRRRAAKRPQLRTCPPPPSPSTRPADDAPRRRGPIAQPACCARVVAARRLAPALTWSGGIRYPARAELTMWRAVLAPQRHGTCRKPCRSASDVRRRRTSRDRRALPSVWQGASPRVATREGKQQQQSPPSAAMPCLMSPCSLRFEQEQIGGEAQRGMMTTEDMNGEARPDWDGAAGSDRGVMTHGRC